MDVYDSEYDTEPTDRVAGYHRVFGVATRPEGIVALLCLLASPGAKAGEPLALTQAY